MAQDRHKPSLGNQAEPTASVAWIKPEYIFTWFPCPEILLNNNTAVQFCMYIFDQVYIKSLHTVGQFLT